MPVLDPSVALALLPTASPLACLPSSVRAQLPLRALGPLLMHLGVAGSPLGRDGRLLGSRPGLSVVYVYSPPQVTCRLVERGLVAVAILALLVVVVVFLAVAVRVGREFPPVIVLAVVSAHPCSVQELGLCVCPLLQVRRGGPSGGRATRRVRRGVSRELASLLCSGSPRGGPLRGGLHGVALRLQSLPRCYLLLAPHRRRILR